MSEGKLMEEERNFLYTKIKEIARQKERIDETPRYIYNELVISVEQIITRKMQEIKRMAVEEYCLEHDLCFKHGTKMHIHRRTPLDTSNGMKVASFVEELHCQQCDIELTQLRSGEVKSKIKDSEK